MDPLVIGAIQMNSRDDRDANVARACALIDEAAAQGANFVGLPEYMTYMGPPDTVHQFAEPIPGPTIDTLRAKAQEHRLWINCGSLPEIAPDGRYYNCSTVLNPQGEVVAKYRKIHLFDVEIPGQVSARESASVAPGDRAVVFDTPWCRMGLTICYDLRFGELHRALAMAGAKVIWGPAAFTLYTGKDHWELLIRARATEHQVFMACPAQFGMYPPAGYSFGAAMVVDPWGTAIARAPERETVTVAPIDLAYLDYVRAHLPVYEHRRPDAYRVAEAAAVGG